MLVKLFHYPSGAQPRTTFQNRLYSRERENNTLSADAVLANHAPAEMWIYIYVHTHMYISCKLLNRSLQLPFDACKPISETEIKEGQ